MKPDIEVTPEYLAITRNGYVKHYYRHTVHKLWVFYYGASLILKLLWRLIIHDYSKYIPPESIGYARAKDTSKYPYGHDYCILAGREAKETIVAHKARNRHHPEFHERGVNGMTLVDFVEMVCDWKAACRKNKGGSFAKSLELNASRYSLNKQVIDILRNS